MTLQQGNCFVTGASGYPTYDYATLGYYVNGNQLWQQASRYHSNSGDSRANWIDIQQITYDKVYVTGFSQSSPYKQYVTIAYYTSNGGTVWSTNYGSSFGDSYGSMVKSDIYDNVYVTGYVGSQNLATVKWDKFGNKIWDNTYGGNAYDGKSIAVDYNGYAYVTGTGYGDNYDYVTTKYIPPPCCGQLTVQNPNGTENQIKNIPASYSLGQNFPNPFNPATMIKYAIPRACQVDISVYDLLGQKVASLVNEHKDAGYYDIRFDGTKLSSGVYIYKIIAGSYTDMKKMVLMK